MVRMAQDFSLRYPLVDGQGNFGSIDGDNAAAMRYTEARLARTDLMLTDLEKDTVGWHPNLDKHAARAEYSAGCPAKPADQWLFGHSRGGMATNIPPHNLGEVVDALVFLIDRFDTSG